MGNISFKQDTNKHELTPYNSAMDDSSAGYNTWKNTAHGNQHNVQHTTNSDKLDELEKNENTDENLIYK